MTMSSPQNCQTPVDANNLELWVYQQFGSAEQATALCILYQESSGNNCAINTSSWDYGLFQLNEYWFKAVANAQGRSDLVTTYENYWWDPQTNIALAKWYFDHNGQGWCAWATHASCGISC